MKKTIKVWVVEARGKVVGIERHGKKTIEKITQMTGEPGKWRTHIETRYPCTITYEVPH